MSKYPKMSEEGSYDWYVTHPSQRMRHPIPMATIFIDEPTVSASVLEVIETWYDHRMGRVRAQAPDGQGASILAVDRPTFTDSRDRLVSAVTEGYLERVRLNYVNPDPPTPAGVGWDDFDWSI